MHDHIDERRRFASLLTALSDYYKSEVSKAVAGLYWEGLRQFDYEVIEKACWAHTQLPDEAGRWMPRIGDIIRMIDGRTEDQAQLAWSKIDKAMRQVGTWDDVVFDDAIIHRVIADMGGWVPLGAKDENEWPFVAKEFQGRYRAYRQRGMTPEYPPLLAGISSVHNKQEGFSNPFPPILIGDERKANEVMSGGKTIPVIGMKPAWHALNIKKENT